MKMLAILRIPAPRIPHSSGPVIPAGMGYSIGLLILLLVFIFGLIFIVRKFMRGAKPTPAGDWGGPSHGTENASAFMTASMQGVIERLRAQEKELARLHAAAQERAQESERLTEEVTRNMPTGLLLVNATGAISSANPAAEDALGIRLLRYRSYREVLGAESELAGLLTACLREGKTIHRGEVEHVTNEGEVRHLGVTISPISRVVRGAMRGATDNPAQAQQSVSGALCLMSDLTELTALQKQIRWKENLAALGEMSAGIAHEFKNSLATISGYAQMIRSEARPGDIHENAERILDQTRALTHVVTEFLRFARPLEICYETVAMETLVTRVSEELHEIFPKCQVDCEGTFIEIPGDEALLRQALLNLVRNAAEAARDAGHTPKIALSGTVEELGGRKWQRVAIADNGPGIPAQELPKVFLPFYTTKPEGTGLGLAVVQKVALQHGGSIEARNRAGGGAEFLLWLPLRQEPLPSHIASDIARV